MKNIGIIGSRRRTTLQDVMAIKEAFAKFYEEGAHIISGGCPTGGDAVAERIAKVEQVPIMIHYARWNRWGKSAGYLRNGDIAKDSDILIACVAEDRTGGTEDTIAKFLARPGVKPEDLILV